MSEASAVVALVQMMAANARLARMADLIATMGELRSRRRAAGR
jgi:hypothetical protein